jgi:uncharacterized protein YndB with AHSA1/START domain
MVALLVLLAAVPPPIEVSAVIDGSAADVYRAWTTPEGAKTFFAPAVKIELTKGGPYEIYFAPDAPPGSRGAEGCTVVSFEANKKVSFTWSFPPSLPALRNANALAQVTVELTPEGTRTKLRLVHDGFKDGPDWEKGREYFSHAWPMVVGRLKHRFAHGPLDWKYPWTMPTLDGLKWLTGSYQSQKGDELQEETWVTSSAGLMGVYRVSSKGKATFHELATIEAEDGELIMRLALFGAGLAPSKRTQAGPLKLVLHGTDGQAALFKGLDLEKATTVLYRVEKDVFRVTLSKDGKPVEEFELTRVAPH